MTVQEQVDALRVLTFHSSWLAYVNPYIHGSTADDELELALALLEEMRNRPRNVPVLLDIHTDDATNPGNVLANMALGSPSLTRHSRSEYSSGPESYLSDTFWQAR